MKSLKCDGQTSENSQYGHLNLKQHQLSQAHECSVYIYKSALGLLLPG